MHFRITSSFQRYILIFKWKALHYNSYNNFFSFTFSLYFPFQFLLHYLSVPKQPNQERDREKRESKRVKSQKLRQCKGSPVLPCLSPNPALGKAWREELHKQDLVVYPLDRHGKTWRDTALIRLNRCLLSRKWIKAFAKIDMAVVCYLVLFKINMIIY